MKKIKTPGIPFEKKLKKDIDFNKKLNNAKEFLTKVEEQLDKNKKETYTYNQLLKENEFLKGVIVTQKKFINDLQKILNKCIE